MASTSTFKHADYNAKTASDGHVPVEELSPAETRQRITALCLVFAVVLFFWMAFHQNGLTLTFFARDYTQASASGLLGMTFNVFNLVLIIALVYAMFSLFQSRTGPRQTGFRSGGSSFRGRSGGAVCSKRCRGGDPAADFPTVQSVLRGSLDTGFVGDIRFLGQERERNLRLLVKIGLGMLIAACGFGIMAFGSMGLPTPDALAQGADVSLVSPNLLISTYLVLTFAELLLSPHGHFFRV